MTRVKQEATALRDLWQTAFNDWDLDGLLCLYSTDALFFGSTPDLCVGHEAIRGYFEALPKPMRAQMGEHVANELSNSIIASSGFADFSLTGKVFQFRLTLVLCNRGEGWKIVQHHASLLP